MVKVDKEKILEYITELDLKSKKLEKKHEVSLPVESYLDKIEKNLETKDKDTLKKQIDFVDRKINFCNNILSLNFSLIDVEEPINDSSSFKEIANKLKKEIKRSIPLFKKRVDRLENLDVEATDIESCRKKINDIESVLNGGNLKKSLQLTRLLEKKFTYLTTQKKDDLKEKIQIYKQKLEDLKQQGAKEEVIQEIGEEIEKANSLISSEDYIRGIEKIDSIGEELNNLSRTHDNFLEKLENVKERLDRVKLPEEKEKEFLKLIDEISELDNKYDAEMERLDEIFNDISSLEKEAKSIVEKIKNEIAKNPILEIVDELIGLVDDMEEKLEEGKWDYIFENGKEHLKDLQESQKALKEIKHHHEEIIKMEDNIVPPPSKFDCIKIEFDSFDIDPTNENLDLEKILEEKDLNRQNHSQACRDIFESLENKMGSLKKDMRSAIIEEREKIESDIEAIRKDLEEIDERYEMDFQSYWEKIEEAEEKVYDEDFEKAQSISIKVEEKINEKKRQLEKQERLEDIYQRISPLADEIEEDTLLDKIRNLEKTVKQKGEEEEKLDLAREVEEEVKEFLKEKITNEKEKIKEEIDSQIDLERCSKLLEKAEKELRDEEYQDSIESLKESNNLFTEKKEKYEKFKKLYEKIEMNLDEMKDRDLDVADMRLELEEAEKVEDLDKAIGMLESIEEKIKKKIKDYSINQLEKIDELRNRMIDNEEKGIKLDPAFGVLEKAYEKINEINSLEERSQREKVFEAREQLEKAEELMETRLERFEKLKERNKEIKELGERAKKAGIEVEELLEGLPEISEKPMSLEKMQEKIDLIRSSESELLKKFEELKENVNNKLDELEGKVTNYRKKKCYFPEFTDNKTYIREKLDQEEYEKAFDELKELEKRIDERIELFKKAREKENLLREVFKRSPDIDLKLEKKEDDFSSLFNYEDYEKANRNYQKLIDEISKSIQEEKSKLEEKLGDFDEKTTKLTKNSHFSPVQAVKKIKEGMELLSGNDDFIPEREMLNKLSKLNEVGAEKAKRLYSNGFESIEDIKDSSKEELQKVEGIGLKLSEKILESVEGIDDDFLESGESDSLLYQMEKCTRLQEIVNDIEKNIEIFEEKKDSLTDNIVKLEDLLSRLKESEIEIKDILQDVHSLTEKKNLEVALEESKAVLEDARELYSKYQRRAENEIQEAEKVLEEKVENGIHIDECREILEEAREKTEKNLFIKAIRHAQESKSLAEKLESRHKEAEEKIGKVESELQECFARGLYPIELALKFEQAKEISEYSEKIERIDEISRKVEDKKRKKARRIEEKIESLFSYKSDLEERGINTRKVEELLKKANENATKMEFKNSLNKIEEAYKLSAQLKEGYERAKDILKETKNKMARFKEMGIEIEDFKNKIEELQKRGEYDSLIEECKKIKSVLDDRRSEKESKIENRMEEVESTITDLEDEGVEFEACLEELGEARKEYEGQDYDSCIAILNKAENLIEKRKSQYEQLNSLADELENKLNTAKTVGLDLDYEEKVERIEKFKKSTDYPSAISDLQEIEAELDELIEEVKQETHSRLEELEGKISDLKERGEEIGMEVHIAEYEEGLRLVEEDNYLEANHKLEDALDKVDQREKVYSTIEIYFNIAEELVEIQIGKGNKVEGLEKQIRTAKNTYTSYEDISEKTDSLKEVLVTYERKSKNLLKEKYMDLKRNLEEKQRTEDLKTEELESKLERRANSLKRERIEEGVKYLANLKEELKEIERKHENFSQKMKKAEDLKETLERFGIDVSGVKEQLAEARSKEDYYSATEIIEESITDLKDKLTQIFEEKKEFISRSKTLLEDISHSTYSDFLPEETSQIERQLSKAEKIGWKEESDIEEFFESVEEIEDKVEPLKEDYMERLLDECEDLQNRIEDIERLEGHISDLKTRLKETIEKIEEGALIECRSDLEALEKIISERIEKTKERNELCEDVDELVEDISKIGVSISDVESLPEEGVQRFKEKEDIESAIESLEEIKTRLEEKKEKWIEDMEGKFEKLRGKKEAIPDKYLETSVGEYEDEIRELLEFERYGDVEEKIEKFESIILNCENKWEEIKNRIELPFTHGIETELQIITQDGNWIEGEKMKEIFEHILEDAKYLVYQKVKRGEGPDYILDKIDGVKVQKDKAGNEAVHVKYEVGGEKDWFSIIGKDSHVTTTTNILEIQTPPSIYLKELEWWLQTVFDVSYKAVKKLGTGLLLVSTGMNSIEGFSQGVTFGDHHHIGIPDEEIRRAAYNLLRNYLPHLIALSVNSPIPGGEIPEIKKNQDGSLISPLTSLSLRIENNIGQLSCPPILEEKDNEERFLEKISRDEESARMIDLYPFTRFGTIEFRISDTQLTLSDRISLAVLIQAISFKAKKLLEKGEMPEKIDEKILLNLRENAYKNGLLSPFLTKSYDLDNSIEEYYPELKDEQGVLKEDMKFVKDACASLMFWLKQEFSEMNLLGSQYIDPTLIKLFGPKSSYEIGSPLTSAQYQLYLLRETNHDLQKFLLILDEISSKSAAHPEFNPIIDDFGYPDVPKALQPTSVSLTVETNEVSYIGESEMKIDTVLSISNQSNSKMEELRIECRYLSDGGERIGENTLNIPVFESDEEESLRFESDFDMEDGEIPSELTLAVYEKSEKLVEKQHPLPPQTEVSLDVSYTGPKLIHADSDKMEIPYSIEVKNPHEESVKGEMNIVVKDDDGKTRDEKLVEIEIDERQTFASVLDVTSDWALNALNKQDYEETEALEVEIDEAEDREKFKIEAKLDLEGKSMVSKESDSFEILR